MLLDDMLTYLSSGGVATSGTNLFAGILPPNPDAAVAVYETGGRGTAKAMGNVAGQAHVEYARVQVVSRGSQFGYAAARQTAQKAFLLLDGLPRRTINGVQYHWASAIQTPFLMGLDEQQRPMIAFNVDVVKALSSTS
jgi:hypothetical protein